VEVAYDNSAAFKGRLLVLTNRGVHIYRPPSSA
jgi:hypothetical protein